jgi:periplasmic protein TonB
MRRVPRLLLFAFAFSLLVHVIVALVMHPAVPTMESQAEVVSIVHRPATIAVTKVPTPPPPRPRQTPAPKNLSSAPPAHNGPGPGANTGAGTPAPSPAVAVPTPAATATIKAGCANADAPVAVVATPAPPDIAPDARASGTSGVALVGVRLDANGQVTGADVTQSTGNSSLDLVALAMAREARYSPAFHDCKPVASAYTFSVKFVAW